MSNGIIKMKGGGGTTYSDVKTTTSNLPEYAEPYYRDLLARTGYETSQPYQAYGGSRLADFSPAEQEAMYRYNQLGMSGTPEELNSAMRSSYNLSQDSGITGGIKSMYQAGGLNGAGDYSTTSRESGYNPGSRSSGYAPGSYQSGYQADRYQSGYQANQMGDGAYYDAGYRDMGFEPGTINDPEMLKSYMNPYFQNVVDIEKREAMRDADMRHASTGLEAAGSGSLGGYREGIVRSETEKQLGTRLGDIQSRGTQAAYQDAKSGFEADRAARAQKEQFAQSQFGLNEQGKQRMAELIQQGFSVNEAARQAQEQFGQSAFGMNEQAKQAQEQFGQSAFGMNEQAKQAAEQFAQSQFGMNEQGRQAAEQFAQNQFGMNSANGQFDAEMGLKQYNAYEAAKQEAGKQGLTAQEIEQAGQIAAAKIKLDATDMLTKQTDLRQTMEMERLKAMQSAGMLDRGMYQASLDQGYEDYLRQQNYGKDQLDFYSRMLQGLPQAQGSTTTSPNYRPTWGQQLMGMGIGGLGIYNAYNQGNQGG